MNYVTDTHYKISPCPSLPKRGMKGDFVTLFITFVLVIIKEENYDDSKSGIKFIETFN